MHKLLISLCFFSGLFIQMVRSQESPEKQLKTADSLWLCSKLTQAALGYQQLLDSGRLPGEYRSLIFLRLADVQYQAGLQNACRSTLSEIKTLSFLPDHHQLKIEELEKKLRGNPETEYTVIPSPARIIASLYVSQTIENNKESGINHKCFTSLEMALEEVHAMIQKPDLAEGIIEIVLLGDNYTAEKTISLDSGLSGTERNPIVIRSSLQNGKTSISGGKNIKTWKRETSPETNSRLPENARNKIWVADFKKNQVSGIDSLVFGGFSSMRAQGGNARFGTFSVPEFFYDGKPQVMARWPNDKDTIIPLINFKDPRVIKWAQEGDLWLHGYWFYLWADAYEKVQSVSLTDTTIELRPPLNRYGFGNSKWHAVNALSELDKPGEWCLSVKAGKIWFFPPDDFNPEKCTLSLSGPVFQAEDCNYLTIKDIDIEYIRGDGMVFRNCSHLTLSDCNIKNASGLGIRISGGKEHLIHTCTIQSMGRGGIDINSGNIPTLDSSGSIIENCKISNLSRIDRTYTPAILLEGVGIRVRHCLFSDIPSSAIRLEGNDMLIEMNEFANCVSESDDQGAIDVWGNPLFRGNVIRWNFFHDIGVPHLHMAAGIRLDDAISGFCIFENLFLRSSNDLFGGIQIHGGKDNYIEGNIFSNCNAAVSQSAWGEKRWEQTLAQEDHPVFRALHNTDWQNELWQKRYPLLKDFLNDNADRNYCVDNTAVNVQSFFLRRSDKLQSWNNTSLSATFYPTTGKDYQNLLVPWHMIPLDKIGPY